MTARRPQIPLGAWPAQLDAAMAAGLCGEPTVRAFLDKVGPVYPAPVRIRDVGDRWLTETLLDHLRRLHGRAPVDAADVL